MCKSWNTTIQANAYVDPMEYSAEISPDDVVKNHRDFLLMVEDKDTPKEKSLSWCDRLRVCQQSLKAQLSK